MKGAIILFLISLVSMVWFYSQEYNNSIGWEVITQADVVESPAIQVKGQLLDFEVTAEKYLLTETYSGGPLTRTRSVEVVLVSLAWVGVCFTLVSASFLKRFGFLAVLALFTLFLNRLNFGDVGLFDIRHRSVVIIPFITIVGPLFYFHEYRPNTSFFLRFLLILASSLALIVWGVSDHHLFLDHFISHSHFSFTIVGLLFLVAISEENIFAILFLVSKGKGGKNNHVHFLMLGSIYLVNLILYYLNKSGYVPNSFSFFDPFILLLISCLVGLWSLKFKARAMADYFLKVNTLFGLVLGLGIAFIAILNLSFFMGNDAFYEGFHYLLLYFHIGFGVFFFFYIIANFIDPLAQGLEVFKIVYKERHFPYLSARLGGLIVVLGFYFLSTQEAYRLVRAAYYVKIGNMEEVQENTRLANEYYKQAAFLGYNTHYANYQLAWHHSKKGNDYLAKIYFEKAASRFPSPYAYVNHALLDMEFNSAKAQAILEEAAWKFKHGEIRNNQGILRRRNFEWDKALTFFEKAYVNSTWNQSPLLNQWATRYHLNRMDSAAFLFDYEKGNYGVKANLLLEDQNTYQVEFIQQDMTNTPVLHRQAYLLNASTMFMHDSLPPMIIEELANSIDVHFNDRLRKNLAIHFYLKGEINEAFLMLDYIQANAHVDKRGKYLNDLGILALDQGAYRLALDFFERSIENDYFSAQINRLEALAALGKAKEIPRELMDIVQKKPELTSMANRLLTNLKEADFSLKPLSRRVDNLDSLSNDELIHITSQNVFNEELVIEGVSLLNQRAVKEAYDIILEAIEINPYAIELLELYVFTALEQKLISYAETIIPKIKALGSPGEFEEFMEKYAVKLDEIEKETW